MIEEDKEIEHPSFGMIGLARTSGGAKLFGSSVDHHNYISLTISRAKLVRGLHHDHYYSKEDLIEVALSPNQLSELLMNMNVGEGVPCTLHRILVDGVYQMVPQPDEVSSSTKTYVDEFKERMAKLAEQAASLISHARSVAEKPTANKTERRELTHELEMMVQELRNNMPFALESYIEQVEKVVTQAKSEIEAHRVAIGGTATVNPKLLALGETKDAQS